jgi:hypothetical protein
MFEDGRRDWDWLESRDMVGGRTGSSLALKRGKIRAIYEEGTAIIINGNREIHNKVLGYGILKNLLGGTTEQAV